MDAAALTQMQTRFAKPLRRFLNKRGVASLHIDDVIQEVWLRLHRYKVEESHMGKPLAYLQKMALNVLRGEMAKCCHTRTHTDVDDFAEILEAPNDSERELLNEERAAIVQAAVDALKPQQREALMLHLGGLTYWQIAERMQMSERCVLRRITNAYAALRANKQIMDIAGEKRAKNKTAG